MISRLSYFALPVFLFASLTIVTVTVESSTVPRHEFIHKVMSAFSSKIDSLKPGKKRVNISDLPVDHPSFKQVSLAVRLGIIKGFPDNSIHAQWSITREASAVVISRILRKIYPKVRSVRRFSDLKKGHWLYRFLKRSGGFFPEKVFLPESRLSRHQFRRMLKDISRLNSSNSNRPVSGGAKSHNKLTENINKGRTLKNQQQIIKKRSTTTKLKSAHSRENPIINKPESGLEKTTMKSGNIAKSRSMVAGDTPEKKSSLAEYYAEKKLVPQNDDNFSLNFDVATHFPDHKLFFFMPEDGLHTPLSSDDKERLFKPLALIKPFAKKIEKVLDQLDYNLLNPQLSLENYQKTETILLTLHEEIKKGLTKLRESDHLLEKKYPALVKNMPEKMKLLKSLIVRFEHFSQRITNDVKYVQSRSDLIDYIQKKASFEALSVEKKFN